MEKTYKKLAALLLLQLLGLFYFKVEAQTCFSTLDKFPKLVRHKTSTGDSRINVMQIGSVNQRLFVGGQSKDPLSGFNDGTQVAFIGFIDNSKWKWRQNAFDFPSFNDPTVRSIAIRADESKIAVLFISSSFAARSDSYVYELNALTGFQTSATKLKLPYMTWSSPQGMAYLDDTSQTLLIALAEQNVSHSKNYIAAVDFTKQGSEQVQIIKLTEIDQLITHLNFAASNEFFMASNLIYNYDGSTVSGIRFVRYAYTSVSQTFTEKTKVLIYDSSFPETFGSQSPQLTAFRFYRQKSEVCGAIKRHDSTSEDIWLFTWDTVATSNMDFKTPGTMKTVLDCNSYNRYLSFFVVQEVKAGQTMVRIHSLDWTSDPIEITIYPVLNSSSTISNTASAMMQGNTSYAYFAMYSNNIFASSQNFSYSTAAIYYSNRNFGSCISKEDSAANQQFIPGTLNLIKENGTQNTPTISKTEIASITNSSFQAHPISFGLTPTEDLCAEDNKSYTLSSTTFSKAIALSAIDFTEKTLEFGVNASISNRSCSDQSTYLNYYISSIDKALPSTLKFRFDSANNQIVFQLQQDFIFIEEITYMITVGLGIPYGVYNDNVGTIQLKIFNNCHATIQSSSQYAIPAYNLNVDEIKVYNFNAFSFTPSSSMNCKITYSLAITKADGSAVSFSLNDSKTSFTLAQTPSLTFFQNKIYTTSGSYKLLLTGSLDGTTQTATVEIPFMITLSCKGSPISWNGSSSIFTNISYSMWDPTSVKNWLWTDVNNDPSQITTQPPSGQTCGKVVLKICNSDTTSFEPSLFFYDQTSFTVGLRTLTGGAAAGIQNLAVFFMYEDSLSDGPYYTNRKDFQVVVTDLCAQQTDSKATVSAFAAVKYLLGNTKISVDITENGRVTFDPAYCPWMATVSTFQVDGITSVSISSDVFKMIGNQALQNPSGISIEVFQASFAADPIIEGYFKVQVKYSLGFIFSTQTYSSNKSQQFDLTIVSCASQFQPPNGFIITSYTQLDPKMFVDVTGTLFDNNCPYMLTMSTTIPSIIDLTGIYQVGIFVNSYDRTKLGSYTVFLTYTWNQSLNIQVVNLTVQIIDNCASQISAPANSSLTYQLMDAGQTFPLNPTISQSYCTFDLSYQSGSDKNLEKIFNFTPGINLDQNSVVGFTLSQSNYDASPVGHYSVVFTLSWSNSSLAKVTITIEITDACKTDVNPIEPATITYQLMSSSQSISVLPIASFSYCVFSIELTGASIGSLFTFQKFLGTKNDSAQLQIFSTQYQRDHVGETQLTFKYRWSKRETRDVIITVQIEDPCIANLVPQTPIDFNYILMQAK